MKRAYKGLVGLLAAGLFTMFFACGGSAKSTANTTPPPGNTGSMATNCPNDRDCDGIPDDQDKCPDKAEDKDGVEDTDGCPEPN